MAAIIEVMDKAVKFDGKNWTSDEPHVANLCRLRADNLPYAYYPHRVNDLAKAVADSLQGRVISLEPYDPEVEGDDSDVCY